MEFGIKDVITIMVFAVGIAATFYGTRFKIKEYVRDRIEKLKDEHNEMKLEIERLKNRDELQEQIIQQLKVNVLDRLPDILGSTNENKKGGRRK